MTIEQAIENAVEGGWGASECMVVGKFGFNYDRAFLDPSFWQSLGKALGWDDESGLRRWKYEWHDFISHLADGGTPETYFKELK